MKVFEFIEKLNRYNPKADIDVVVNGYPKPFEICCGSSEGCTPKICDRVGLVVETSNEEMLSTDDPIQLMTFAVEKVVENMEKFIEKIEHPIGKTIVAAIIKEVLIPAIEEAEAKLKEGKG